MMAIYYWIITFAGSIVFTLYLRHNDYTENKITVYQRVAIYILIFFGIMIML